MISKALATKLLAGRTMSFWEDVKSVKDYYNQPPSRIEDSIEEKDIVNFLHAKFSRTLSSVEDFCSKNKLYHLLVQNEATSFEFVSVSKMKSILKELSLNRRYTPDQFHVTFY